MAFVTVGSANTKPDPLKIPLGMTAKAIFVVLTVNGSIGLIPPMTNLSAEQLRRAATIKDEIESLESELSKILGGGIIGNGRKTGKRMGRPPGSGKKGGDVTRYKAAHSGKKKRKGMSAAAKARISAAAKARWAKAKAAGKNSL
jgi:hypothetical protein